MIRGRGGRKKWEKRGKRMGRYYMTVKKTRARTCFWGSCWPRLLISYIVVILLPLQLTAIWEEGTGMVNYTEIATGSTVGVKISSGPLGGSGSYVFLFVCLLPSPPTHQLRTAPFRHRPILFAQYFRRSGGSSAMHTSHSLESRKVSCLPGSQTA